jgi:hypothetical protein
MPRRARSPCKGIAKGRWLSGHAERGAEVCELPLFRAAVIVQNGRRHSKPEWMVQNIYKEMIGSITLDLKGTIRAQQFLLGSIVRPVVHMHPDIGHPNQKSADQIEPVRCLRCGSISGN